MVHNMSRKSSEMQPAKLSHLCLTCEDLSSTCSSPSCRTRTAHPMSHLACRGRGGFCLGSPAQGPIFLTCKGGLLAECISKNPPLDTACGLPVQPLVSLCQGFNANPLRTLQAGSGRRGSGRTRAVAQQAGGCGTMQPAPSNVFQSLLRQRVKDVGCQKS